eukprot:Rmarinus@m.4129
MLGQAKEAKGMATVAMTSAAAAVTTMMSMWMAMMAVVPVVMMFAAVAMAALVVTAAYALWILATPGPTTLPMLRARMLRIRRGRTRLGRTRLVQHWQWQGHAQLLRPRGRAASPVGRGTARGKAKMRSLRTLLPWITRRSTGVGPTFSLTVETTKTNSLPACKQPLTSLTVQLKKETMETRQTVGYTVSYSDSVQKFETSSRICWPVMRLTSGGKWAMTVGIYYGRGARRDANGKLC